MFTLYFIRQPVSYGSFLAYLSLVSILANLLLGTWSDRIKKRIVFLYPIAIVLSLIAFLFLFGRTNFIFWLILTGAVQFLMPLFWNLSTAIVIDAHANLRFAIPGRELALNIGRVIGLSFTFIDFSLEPIPKYIFIFLSLVMLSYAVVLKLQARKIKELTLVNNIS